MTIENNRITSPDSVANAATNAQLKPISPTGTPVLPQIAVVVATVLVAIAGVVLSLPAMGIALPAAVTAICTAVISLGAVFGIASPGVRKKE